MTNRVRILCIDFGSRFIGLAVADFPGITARALHTIDAGRHDPISEIKKHVVAESANHILLGFPFSDVEGEIHLRIRAFFEQLKTIFPDFPVEYVDESYSSQEADALINETGI